MKIKYQLLAPLPRSGIPIYCVGLNYRTHAEEAKVQYAPRNLSRQFDDKVI
jgi:2-keto-4-pentenoate hydratase/2-oxohepta-3-ene-1,7-dioic acid hydratase in catechol pathway